MKVFISDPTAEEGFNNATQFHWTNKGEVLCFAVFQDKKEDVSMVGMTTRKSTTHIIVEDLDLTKNDFYKMYVDSVTKAMDTDIDMNGNYMVNVNGLVFKKNAFDEADELLKNAEFFNSGDHVRVSGREMFLKGKESQL